MNRMAPRLPAVLGLTRSRLQRRNSTPTWPRGPAEPCSPQCCR